MLGNGCLRAAHRGGFCVRCLVLLSFGWCSMAIWVVLYTLSACVHAFFYCISARVHAFFYCIRRCHAMGVQREVQVAPLGACVWAHMTGCSLTMGLISTAPGSAFLMRMRACSELKCDIAVTAVLLCPKPYMRRVCACMCAAAALCPAVGSPVLM
jgi:hypothetical protein